MPYDFGGISTIGFDGAIRWTSGTATESDVDPAEAIGRKLWDWCPNPKPLKEALAEAIFSAAPQAYVAGWMPGRGGKPLTCRACIYPLPQDRDHNLLVWWSDSHSGTALTPTEARTLSAASDGMTHEQIARSMRVSQNTVKTTLTRVRRKLGAKTLAHAVKLALLRAMI